jgi:hypothetical protein
MMAMTNTRENHHRCNRIFGFWSAIIVAIGLLPEEVHADYWGASAATAVPEYAIEGSIKSYTITDRSLGIGVASRAIPRRSDCEGMPTVNCLSIARLFVPVTAPLGTRFETIWLRAFDTSQIGYVQASLYRQQVGFRDRKLLGFVMTQTGPRDSGFQVLTGPVESHLIDQNRNPLPVEIGPGYTYYIEIAIARGLELQIPSPQGISENLIAYDVGLDFELTPCNPGHPDFDPQKCL